MDCRFFNENIDLFVDGLLSETERKQLLDHAASCVVCGKALDDAVRLKSALSSLGEVDPPQGLALSAIKKAKKKKPVFAYVSAATAAVAAAIALLVILTPGLNMENSTRMSDESVMFSRSAEEEAGVDAEMAPAPADDANVMMEAPQEALGSTADEAAPKELEETESMAGVERDAGTAEYANEEDFVAAEDSSYYKPASLPDGAWLEKIMVDEESITFSYRLENGDMFAFEWLDALDENGLGDWLRKAYGDLSELDFDGIYYTVSGETVTDVYWEQSTDAFHAAVPSWFTAADIAAFCSAQFVQVQDTEEE